MIRVKLRTARRLRVVLGLMAVVVFVSLTYAINSADELAGRLFEYCVAITSAVRGAAQTNASLVTLELPLQPIATVAGVLALQLSDYVPDSVQIESLAADAEGNYVIEGSCLADELSTLRNTLEALRGVPTEVSLSYWRDADLKYRFVFRGVLHPAVGRKLIPLERDAAHRLFERVVRHAATVGLNGVNAGAVNTTRLADGLHRQRARVWAVGSRSGITAFTESVVHEEPHGALSELLLIPIYAERASRWENAQIFATVDAVVNFPGSQNGENL